MKHHDGTKKINKVDGGKRKARKQKSRVTRQRVKRKLKEKTCFSCHDPLEPDDNVLCFGCNQAMRENW